MIESLTELGEVDRNQVMREAQEQEISEEELYDLISSFGNHEAKAITLALMGRSQVYDVQGATRLLNSSQKPFQGWMSSIGTAFGYMNRSLAPVGLVAKEITEGADQKIIGYVKTERGFSLGDPLAGLLLDYSLKHPSVSLIDLFSLTSSRYFLGDDENGRKKRSPETNMKLFWELLTTTLPTRATDLADAIGEAGSTIGSHLNWLGARGIISYETIKAGESISYYEIADELPERELPSHPYRTKLIRDIFKILKDNSGARLTINQVIEQYIEQYSPQASKENLAKKINFALSLLRKNGFAKSGVLTMDKKSIVNLSEEQRQALIELLEIIDGFRRQDKELIEFGKNRLVQIISDPKSVAELMEKAKEHSSFAPHMPHDAIIIDIAQIFLTQGNLTTEEIRERLEAVQARKWKRGSVSNYLKEMTEQGLLSRELVRGRFEYSYGK